MPDYQGCERLKILPEKAKVQSFLNSKNAYGTRCTLKVLPTSGSKVRIHFSLWNSFDAAYLVSAEHMRSEKQNQDSSRRQMKAEGARQSASSVDPTNKKSDNHTKPFAIGTYVMAVWRNDFEYLAEVLAHRQRQGNKSEYRLRYIWDRVVEWTSVGRVRKATQYEIDYVLKFCREHTVSRAEKTCRLDMSHSNLGAETNVPCTRPKRLRLSSEVVPEEGYVETKCDSRPSSDVQVAECNRPGCPVSSLDSKTEQDGMLYDKSVIQFHEACRKRRELKRQAIEAEQNSTSQHSTTEPHSSEKSTRKTECIGKLMDESTNNSNENMPNVFNSTTGPLLSKNNRDERENIIDSKIGSDQSEEISKATSTTCSSDKTLHIASSSTKESGLASANLLNTSMSDSPTVFPCPFCPRKLRNSKLLNAHLRNYHKEVPTKVPIHNADTSDVNSILSEKLSSSQFSIEGLSANGSDGTLSQGNPKSFRLLMCNRCNFRSLSDNHDLIQCKNCLYWVHCSCYDVPTNKDCKSVAKITSNKSNFCLSYFLICDGCRLASRPRRKSREYEWQSSIYQKSLCPENYGTTISESDPRKLCTEISMILDRCSRIRPLVRSGWNSLKKINLPTINSPSNQFSSNLPLHGLSCTDPTTQQIKIKDDPNESISDIKTSEDQVNRLYMELRGIAFGDSQGITPVKYTNQTSQSDMNLFSVSTSDSECSTNCWQIYEAAESAVNSYNLPTVSTNQTSYAAGTQELSGFFQDLGPDIIPEISGLAYDGTLDDVSNTNAPVAIEEFFKVPRSLGTSQPSPQRPKRLLNGDNIGFSTVTKDRYPGSLLPDTTSQTFQDKALIISMMDTTSKLLSEEMPASVVLPQSTDVFACTPDIDLKISSTCNKPNSDLSMDLLEQQASATPIINLPLPACARSIMSDLLKGSLCDEFGDHNSNNRQGYKVPTSIGLTSAQSNDDIGSITPNYGICNLDMEWFDASSSKSVNQSANDAIYTCQPSVEKHDHASDNTTGLSRDDVIKTTQAQSEFSLLDNYLLSPLEEALNEMESQLNILSVYVSGLEKSQLNKQNHCPNPVTRRNAWHLSTTLDSDSHSSVTNLLPLGDSSFQMYKAVAKSSHQTKYDDSDVQTRDSLELSSRFDVHRFLF